MQFFAAKTKAILNIQTLLFAAVAVLCCDTWANGAAGPRALVKESFLWVENITEQDFPPGFGENVKKLESLRTL